MAMNKVLDEMFKIISETLVKKGMEPITPIKEYYPHTWKGQYRIFIYHKDMPVEIQAFKSKWFAERYLKENGLQEGKKNAVRSFLEQTV